MPDLQELLAIALRYVTRMSDAMILACYECAYRQGVVLMAPSARATTQERGERPHDDVDWGRMVRSNSDTRHNHC